MKCGSKRIVMLNLFPHLPLNSSRKLTHEDAEITLNQVQGSMTMRFFLPFFIRFSFGKNTPHKTMRDSWGFGVIRPVLQGWR